MSANAPEAIWANRVFYLILPPLPLVIILTLDSSSDSDYALSQIARQKGTTIVEGDDAPTASF
jgi:hypothetical protein